MDLGSLTFPLWMIAFYSVESHISFMDDSILFCRAKEIERQVILDLLVVYEKKDLDRKSIEIRKTFFFPA